MPSRPTRLPTRSHAWSSGCSRLRFTGSGGAGTGWTSPATPTPRAMSSRPNASTPSPTPTATTWSGLSTRDLPFDRFLLQQIAADQLDLGGEPGPLAAMGFLTVGRRFLNDQNEIIDDRIDLIGRGLLGLSIGCARCHDHKFDPIPSEDYYSLYGVFASSVEPDDLPRLERPGEPPDPQAESHQAEIEKARKERDDYLATRRAEVQNDLQQRFSRYLKAAYDLKLDPRHPMLDERAEADKLVPQRLRAAILIWKRQLDSADAPRNPVLGLLLGFAALPKENFAAKASDLVRGLPATGAAKGWTVHPLIVKLFRDRPPASMDQVVARYVELLTALETRSTGR